ncbi:MAG: M20/M25/M40 family metallo-hydrolase, partial [Spirochaetales bacterium]|nr:M20/M25/M40 family metallo-hydrolase [Spirochaetales bacterium]
MNTLDTIFNQIDSYRDVLIDLQSNLTSRPAIAPDAGGQGEYEKVMWLKSYLSQMGFDAIDEYDAPDERVPQKIRPTLVATINGKDTSRSIWIIAHTDVVPPGEQNLWISDPFQIRVDGDLIFGRGTEDNQQGLCSAVLAAKAILDSHVIPTYNVKLMFVADEEVGSEYGITYILEHHQDIFGKNDIIIVPDVGDPIGQEIEISEKSILWVLFHIVGIQAHGSKPD